MFFTKNRNACGPNFSCSQTLFVWIVEEKINKSRCTFLQLTAQYKTLSSSAPRFSSATDCVLPTTLKCFADAYCKSVQIISNFALDDAYIMFENCSKQSYLFGGTESKTFLRDFFQSRKVRKKCGKEGVEEKVGVKNEGMLIVTAGAKTNAFFFTMISFPSDSNTLTTTAVSIRQSSILATPFSEL